MTTRSNNKTYAEINFKIDHIDPLGQGVFKEGENVYFIPKTLPNETGTARILKKKKKIHFCELIKLDNEAQERTNSICPHYEKCTGCHFLHTDYESELNFKLKTYKRILSKLEATDIKLIKSPERMNYRNRIQLHRNRKKIGFFKYQSRDVIEVPNCKIIVPELKKELSKVYQERPHFKEHIELYFKDGEVTRTHDLRYAQGGFTQVNQAANKLMLDEVAKIIPDKDLSIIDLFAGNGNISDVLNYKTRMCIDKYPESYADFINLDLYAPHALNELRESEIDLLILDPPRAGFKELNAWVKKFKPKKVLYISCHPMTMTRDLGELDSHYKIKQTYLIDLFPSTYHFEGMILLERD